MCDSRLHLPGPVVEDDKSKGSFDATLGDYIVTLSKLVKGQHFEDLDMINALIKPPSGKSVPSIELLNGTCCSF
jgi:protein SHQ1